MRWDARTTTVIYLAIYNIATMSFSGCLVAWHGKEIMTWNWMGNPLGKSPPRLVKMFLWLEKNTNL